MPSNNTKTGKSATDLLEGFGFKDESTSSNFTPAVKSARTKWFEGLLAKATKANPAVGAKLPKAVIDYTVKNTNITKGSKHTFHRSVENAAQATARQWTKDHDNVTKVTVKVRSKDKTDLSKGAAIVFTVTFKG